MIDNGLLNNFQLFGGGMGGLLDDETNKALQNQALKSAGLTTALSYFAQPKNRNVGSVVPYLAQAGLTGYTTGQQVYGQGLGNVLRNRTLQAALGKQANSPFAKVDPTKIDYSKTTSEDIKQYQETQNPTFLKFKEEAPIQTEFNKEFDKKAVPDIVDFVIGGGFSDAQKSLTQLQDAINTLETTDEGTITGRLVGASPEAYKQKFNRPAVDTRDKVQEIVQRNLRLILGAQFTENEGKMLIQRAYNENQPQAVNARRLRLLQKQIFDAAKNKQDAYDYVRQNKTLFGFEGKLYTQSMDFFNEYDAAVKGLEKDDSSMADTKEPLWEILP